MATCEMLPSDAGFSPAMLRFLDCQAQSIGAGGYGALAAPGSTASFVLSGLLTLFVALFGFRMLFGYTPGVRDGVLAFVKIGVVLALATSWPAYQTLIYDVVLRSPAQIANEIGSPSGLPGTSGGMSARLDGVDRSFDALAIAGVGYTPATPTAPPLFIGFDTFALGSARVLFLAGAMAAFAIVRLAAGLLLALGPLFIAFLLFEGTRGLFEGWARGLIGAALGALATSIVLGVELTLLEPWLYDLLARRATQQAITGAPAQLLATTIVFAIVLAAILAIVARLAAGFRLPISWPSFGTEAGVQSAVTMPSTRHGGDVAIDNRSRAAAVADAVAVAQRRETSSVVESVIAGDRRTGVVTTSAAAAARSAAPVAILPLGQGGLRRTATRRSSSAGMRDKRP